jgi:hypothetical protein
MTQTVTECLTAATDSVTLINDINTNGNKSKYVGGTTDADGNSVAGDMSQAKINEIVQRNVDHLEIILEYTDPNVKGSSNSKKTDCTTAIATGNTYISNNS